MNAASTTKRFFRRSRNTVFAAALASGILLGRDATAQMCLNANVPLQWYGGPVLHHPKVYLVAWGWGYPAQDPNGEIVTLVNELGGSSTPYGSGISNTRWLNTVSQYYDYTGNAGSSIYYGGLLFDNFNPYPQKSVPPNNCSADGSQQGPTNAQIGAEAVWAKFQFGVQGDPDAIMVILRPPNSWWPGPVGGPCGAYHDSAVVPGYPDAAFADIAYMSGTTCCGPPDQALFHEIAEAITDPFPNTTGLSWLSSGNLQCEIADKGSNGGLSGGNVLERLNTLSSQPNTFLLPSLFSNDALSHNGSDGRVTARSTRTDNFYVGADGAIWRQQDANNGASSVGLSSGNAKWMFPPGATSMGPGAFTVVAVDVNGNLGEWRTVNDWQTKWYTNLGAAPSAYQYSSKPDVTSFGYGRTDIFINADYFALGNTRVLHRSIEDTVDSGWVDIGTPSGLAYSVPAAVSWGGTNRSAGPGRIDVFTINQAQQLYQSTTTNGVNFSTWTLIPNTSGKTFAHNSDIDAASWGPGRLDVFVRTTDANGTLARWFSSSSGSGWDTWAPPAGFTFAGSPTAAGMGDGRLKVTMNTGTGLAQGFWNFSTAPTWTTLNANFGELWQTGSMCSTY